MNNTEFHLETNRTRFTAFLSSQRNEFLSVDFPVRSLPIQFYPMELKMKFCVNLPMNNSDLTQFITDTISFFTGLTSVGKGVSGTGFRSQRPAYFHCTERDLWTCHKPEMPLVGEIVLHLPNGFWISAKGLQT